MDIAEFCENTYCVVGLYINSFGMLFGQLNWRNINNCMKGFMS